MGSIFPASDAAKWIEEQNKTTEGYRTWRQMYGAVDLARQQKLGEARLATEESISDAFAEAYAARQAIASSNYFKDYKDKLEGSISSSLDEAYNSYLNSYYEQAQKINTNAEKEISEITEARDTEAEKYSSLGEKPYEYLQYLYNTYYEDESAREKAKTEGFDWEKSSLWSKFLKNEIDEEGKETGKKVLRSWEELANYGDEDTISPFFDTDESGEKYLSQAGVDFFDMMLNSPLYSTQIGGQNILSFDEWLRRNDEELFDWYSTANPYSYIPNSESKGGNLFRQFVGLKSDDMKYQWIERAGGMSEKQINNMLNNFTTKLEKLGEDYHNDYKDISEGATTVLGEVRTLMNELGLSVEINDYFKEQGISWDSVANDIQKIADQVKSKGELASDFFSGLSLGSIYGTGAGMAASAGIKASSAIGSSLIPGVASGIGATGIGAIIGGAVALIAGITIGSTKAAKGRKLSEYYSEQTKKQVLNYITNVTSYAQALRANKQEGIPMNYQYKGYEMPTLDEWKSDTKKSKASKTESLLDDVKSGLKSWSDFTDDELKARLNKIKWSGGGFEYRLIQDEIEKRKKKK